MARVQVRCIPAAASLLGAGGQPAGREPAGNLALAALNAVAGDRLVQPASAHGRRRSRQHIPFPLHLGRGFGGIHHFDLLNHPDVWAAIRGLLRPET